MAAPRILIVADDGPTSQALERALVTTSATVHVASRTSVALRVLADHAPDIMLVDVDRRDHGGLSALELTRLVRERASDVDIIAITATPSAVMTTDMIRAGAADCLDNAMLANEIGGVIDSIMERRRYRRERVPWPARDLGEPAIIGRDPKFMRVWKQVPRLARSDDPVLIVGERGTGKMGVAREIHRLSRAGEPFNVLESTSIAPGVAESELFGHVKGAFTDATKDRKGYFEQAGRGTIVIDEVADLTPGTQGKLLRVLQERELIPVGGTTTIKVYARVIAITNRPLEDEVDAGTFRADLYDRLLVGRLELPPLREHRGDIPELTRHFIAKAAKELKLPAPPFVVPAAMDALVEYDWPGNVRELENMIKPAVLNAVQYAAPVILLRDLDVKHRNRYAAGNRSERPQSEASASPPACPSGETNHPHYLRPADPDTERANMKRALEEAAGNRRLAAKRLGMARSHLYQKIAIYGLEQVGRE